MSSTTPYGYCHCGCGEKTRLAPRTSNRRGWVRGEPLRFVLYHQNRRTPEDYQVDPATGCWVWLRYINRLGYGYKSDRGRMRNAHVVYYEQHVGLVPDGLELDHLCRNRACVNPAHLEPVTRTENVRRGDRARLNVAAAQRIRAEFAEWAGTGDAFAEAAAAEHGVHPSTIKGVLAGRTWKVEAAA